MEGVFWSVCWGAMVCNVGCIYIWVGDSLSKMLLKKTRKSENRIYDYLCERRQKGGQS